MDIFDFLYDDFKFKKGQTINLFEAFSGIGSQAMSLRNVGFNVKHIGISEIDRYALQSYGAIHGDVKNYGGIGDFERLPKDIDICTWSFPCQDISLAGTQSGMVDGSRSNYGYVFLDTVENTPYDERPKVLLMENVKALFSQKFKDDWTEIQLRLERLGYTNYADSMIATDFGVPQTRDRVFIVSILGEFNYSFPKPIPLVKRLGDYLEDDVDEKYYLSDKQVDQINSWKSFQNPIRDAKLTTDKVVQTITAKSNTSMNASMVLIVEKTLKEQLVEDLLDSGILKEHDIINHSYTNSAKKENSRLEPKDFVERDDGLAPTLTTRVDTLGVVVKSSSYDLRIRKLTPLEAWRLMGISDEDFNKAQSSGTSDSQLYKQAGNAIVVDVLMAIFKELIE